MDEDSERINTFLYELYQQVDDQDMPQVSMHTVGDSIGMDKNEATALAEELMINELVELKTLAGEIGITPAGIEVLQEHGLISNKEVPSCKLSGEPVLTAEDQQIIQEILSAVRLALANGASDFARLEEAVIDIKTIEVQLLSPRPKTTVVLAVLLSLKKSLQNENREDIFSKFEMIFEGM